MDMPAANDKLHEAEFFFIMMEKSFETYEFRYFVSAFLSASPVAQSTTGCILPTYVSKTESRWLPCPYAVPSGMNLLWPVKQALQSGGFCLGQRWYSQSPSSPPLAFVRPE